MARNRSLELPETSAPKRQKSCNEPSEVKKIEPIPSEDKEDKYDPRQSLICTRSQPNGVATLFTPLQAVRSVISFIRAMLVDSKIPSKEHKGPDHFGILITDKSLDWEKHYRAIAWEEHLVNLVRELSLEPVTLIQMALVFETYFAMNGETTYLHSDNVHYLTLCSLLVAYKCAEDPVNEECLFNSHFAKKTGIDLKMLNILEATFLQAIKFNVYCDHNRFKEMESTLAGHLLLTHHEFVEVQENLFDEIPFRPERLDPDFMRNAFRINFPGLFHHAARKPATDSKDILDPEDIHPAYRT